MKKTKKKNLKKSKNCESKFFLNKVNYDVKK